MSRLIVFALTSKQYAINRFLQIRPQKNWNPLLVRANSILKQNCRLLSSQVNENSSSNTLKGFDRNEQGPMALGLLDDSTDNTENSALKERVETLPSLIFKSGPDEYRTIPLIRGIVTDRFNLDLMVFGELASKTITDELINFTEDVALINRCDDRTSDQSKTIDNALQIFDTQKLATPISANKYMNTAQNMKLFAMNIPVEYGGLELGSIETASLLEAAGAENLSEALALASHNIFVCRAINYYGNDKQKSHFLPDLASGKLLGQLCRPDRQTKHSSFSSSEDKSVNIDLDDSAKTHRTCSKASHSNVIDDEYSYKGYYGELWTYEPNNNCAVKNLDNYFDSQTLTLFTGAWSMCSYDEVVVEEGRRDHHFDSLSYQSFSHSPIQHHGQPVLMSESALNEYFDKHDRLANGLNNLSRKNLHLKNSKNNLFSPDRSSTLACCNSDICDTVIAEEAYLLIGCAVGKLKSILKFVTSFCANRVLFNRKLSQFTSIQAFLFEAEIRIYALQSVVYYIAGMVDTHKLVNVRFESQLAFAFAHQLFEDCLDNLSSVCGADNRFCEIDQSDDNTYLARCLERTKDDLQSFRYLLGDRKLLLNSLKMQLIQMLESESAQQDKMFLTRSNKSHVFFTGKRRNRLRAMQGLIEGKTLRRSEVMRFSKILPYRLFENVHPTLRNAALRTEKAAYSLNTGTRSVQWGGYNILVKDNVSKSGVDEMQRHHWITYDPLLQIAFNVLVMCACVSRASRSKCLGLKHFDDEIKMTNVLCNVLGSQSDELLKPLYECFAIRIIPVKRFNIDDENIYPQHPLDSS